MRVLVADDERVIADTLAMILRAHGFEAFPVYSGELAITSAISLNPDLLISDLMMGELDGIDTAVRIRALAPHCKVILLSGQANTADLHLRTRLEKHSLQILPKPIMAHSLLQHIHALCG